MGKKKRLRTLVPVIATLSLFAMSAPFLLSAETEAVAKRPTSSKRVSEPAVLATMYHRFVSPAEFGTMSGDERIYSIGTDQFEAQLAELCHCGIRSLSLAEVLHHATGRAPVTGPSVFITIDDGNRSVLTLAQPLLIKYGMRATLFITTDASACVFDPHRPDQARLSRDEIQRLDPMVFDVGAHGATHRPLRELSDSELSAELTTSRGKLERWLGRPVLSMAVPGNWYDDRVLQFARTAGYEAVFTSDRGLIMKGSDLYRLPRFTIQGYKKLEGFRRLIARAMDVSLSGNDQLSSTSQ